MNEVSMKGGYEDGYALFVSSSFCFVRAQQYEYRRVGENKHAFSYFFSIAQ